MKWWPRRSADGASAEPASSDHANDQARSSPAIDKLRALDAHVRPDFRKTVAFGLIALVALVAGKELGGVHAKSTRLELTAFGCALLVLVFGIAASRTAANEVERITSARVGVATAAPLRIFVLLVGYLIAVFGVLYVLDIDLSKLLVGGAVAGVVIGIAAQQVLGNLFAGLVMIFARPYVPGEYVRVLSGALGGPHNGTVHSVGLLYTTLRTDDGPLNIPNSALLASAVGPIDPPVEAEAEDEPASRDGE